MDRNKLRRWGWSVYAFIGSLAIILLIGSLITPSGPWKSILLNLSTEFLGVAVLFFVVKELLGWRPEEEQQKKTEQVISEVVARLSEIPRGPKTYLSRDSIYWTESEYLRQEHWEKLRIFAPTELWKPHPKKEENFQELAAYAEQRKVGAIWAVFGLPPEIRDGKYRKREEIVGDLQYARKMLDILAGLPNVVIHYYPPFHASIGLAITAFESTKDKGFVAFGFISKTHETVVDVAFTVEDEQIFQFVTSWFDEQIFWKETRVFVLQDETHDLADTWQEAVRTWYSEDFLSDIASEV